MADIFIDAVRRGLEERDREKGRTTGAVVSAGRSRAQRQVAFTSAVPLSNEDLNRVGPSEQDVDRFRMPSPMESPQRPVHAEKVAVMRAPQPAEAAEKHTGARVDGRPSRCELQPVETTDVQSDAGEGRRPSGTNQAIHASVDQQSSGANAPGREAGRSAVDLRAEMRQRALLAAVRRREQGATVVGTAADLKTPLSVGPKQGDPSTEHVLSPSAAGNPSTEDSLTDHPMGRQLKGDVGRPAGLRPVSRASDNVEREAPTSTACDSDAEIEIVDLLDTPKAIPMDDVIAISPQHKKPMRAPIPSLFEDEDDEDDVGTVPPKNRADAKGQPQRKKVKISPTQEPEESPGSKHRSKQVTLDSKGDGIAAINSRRRKPMHAPMTSSFGNNDDEDDMGSLQSKTKIDPKMLLQRRKMKMHPATQPEEGSAPKRRNKQAKANVNSDGIVPISFRHKKPIRAPMPPLLDDDNDEDGVGTVHPTTKTYSKEQRQRKKVKTSPVQPSEESAPEKRRKVGSKAPKEKRGARYRPHPSKSVLDRFKRSSNHRLYLVERETQNDGNPAFAVMGSNGNIYKCKIGLKSSCNCPDFLKRCGQAGEGPCKHLIFVFIRVLKVDKEDPKWWQSRLLPSELQELVENAAKDPTADCDVIVDGAVRDKYRQSMSQGSEPTPGRRPLEGDCPVCFEDIQETEGGQDAEEACTHCKSCFNNFHKICIENWLRARSDATCPLCRAPISAQSEKGPAGGEGSYLNLAAYSAAHERQLTLAELYEGTHQFIGRGGRGGRSGRRGR